MEWLTDPQIWIALATLTFLEIVLGVDNIIFISILSGKLPADQQPRARRLGLLGAMVTRVLLLFSLAWIIRLTEPLFTIWARQFSGRDLILLGGGLFLIGKSTYEIHDKLEGEEGHGSAKVAASFVSVIIQIMLLDIVFSLDSVITAVGMVDELWVMIAAVIISVGIMMASAEAISAFVHKHPTVKMLALSFLLLIGMSLILEGFDHHIPKGYIYFAMGFSVFVEMINLRLRKVTKPVHLHERYTEEPGREPPGTAREAMKADCCSHLASRRRPSWQQAPRRPRRRPPADYVPQRVFDTRRGAFIDFEIDAGGRWRAPTWSSSASSTTIPTRTGSNTRSLSGLRRRRIAPTVSLEMFERDVQDALDRYLSGAIAEAAVSEGGRPWPRYATDYRPLVELAKPRAGRSSPPTCRAASRPRLPSPAKAASSKLSSGRSAAGGRGSPVPARRLLRPVHAGDDRPLAGRRQAKPSAASDRRTARHAPIATTGRSACKDETMAESIAPAVDARAGKPGPVVHFTGAFHSDFGAGTAERTRRRLAGKPVTVVSMLPVADLDTLAPPATISSARIFWSIR